MATPYPSRYVVLDTETARRLTGDGERTEVQRFRLGVARVYADGAGVGGAYRTEYLRDPAEFHQVVASLPFENEPIYIFAHNMAFDARIVEWARALGNKHYLLRPPPGVKKAGVYNKPYFVTGSPPFIVRTWRPDGQKIWWLDSYNWLPRSLEAIGDMLKYEKGEMPAWEAPDDEWYPYCERDVDVLDMALRRLWDYLKSHRLGDFQFTAAMQAMILWRKRYERKQIKRPDDPKQTKLDRMGYAGGFQDCFNLGRIEGPVYQVDCNGLYPWGMRTNPAPAEIVEFDLSGRQRFRPEDLPLGECTAEVYLRSDGATYPVKALDGTFHATGKVHTVLCGPELVRAHARGHIDHIKRYVRYKLLPLFVGYVSTLDKYRMDAFAADDEFARLILKGLLNSLFGKFGQRTGEWIYQGMDRNPREYCEGMLQGETVKEDTVYRILGGHCWHRTLDREDRSAMVAIAAWCNSYARVYMEEAREVAGAGNVHYQATDSLLVSRAGYGRMVDAGMIDPCEMGKFKLEKTYAWVNIKNVNYLETDLGLKAAGIPKKYKRTGEDEYEIQVFESFDEALAAKRLNEVWVRTQRRRLSAHFHRRRVLSGGKTEPHYIDNWKLSLTKQAESCLIHGDE